jgi:hypothetical protein
MDISKLNNPASFGLAPTTIVAAGGTLTPPKRSGVDASHLNRPNTEDSFELTGRRNKSVSPAVSSSDEKEPSILTKIKSSLFG